MSDIKWKKAFDVSHEKGAFRMFVAEHTNGYFFASILYFQRKEYANIFDTDHSFIEFKLQTCSGTSEGEAVAELKRWIKENLGSKFSIHAAELMFTEE